MRAVVCTWWYGRSQTWHQKEKPVVSVIANHRKRDTARRTLRANMQRLGMHDNFLNGPTSFKARSGLVRAPAAPKRPLHNMPRSTAQLKMQDCLRIGLWRSDALGVSHLSRKLIFNPCRAQALCEPTASPSPPNPTRLLHSHLPPCSFHSPSHTSNF